MALKPDRSIVGNQTDISYFYNSTAEKGEVLVLNTSGSGAAMDDANATVARPSVSTSGEVFAGIVLNDVVNKDLTQAHLNQYGNEVQQGGKVTLAQSPAVLVTDMIKSGDSPSLGDYLYFTKYTHNNSDETNRGVLTTTETIAGGEGTGVVSAVNVAKYAVARALSTKDDDGYCKVRLI